MCKYSAAAVDLTPQLKQDLDQSFADLLTRIEQMEDAYILTHDRYFQGLTTHTVRPEDGAELSPTRLNTRPYYQAESWADTSIVVGDLPFSVYIDQYHKPVGRGNREELGYLVTAELLIGGEVYTKSQGYGPQAVQFTLDWSLDG